MYIYSIEKLLLIDSIKLMIYQPDELHIHLCLGKSVITDNENITET